MFSPPRLTGSCFAPKAIGVALVASSLASCGPDITRFDNRSYRAASYSLHPNSESSSTRTASGLDPFFVIRPKADVPIAGPGHTAGLPSPRNALAHLSNRQQKVASKEAHVLSRNKEKPGGQHPIIDAEARTPQTPAKTQQVEPQIGQAGRPFQWPLNGKILATFGARSNGLENQGIAIAVPQDTPITCAEDGEVIKSNAVMLSVVLARPETSALLSFILKFEKVRSPSIRYLYWQYVPLKLSRAAGEGGERRNALVRQQS